ncbi:MAG: NAD-dependent epimerase/dehydratase family protein, partial [Patescibacteria group bacterium]|nr:NAD-dependent epimerase/dehydratase family protein [Patescibacteria group bacterium]
MKRVAITGSSGYLGSCFIKYLAATAPEVQILGLDVVRPADGSGYEHLDLDMQSPRLESILRQFAPDTVVHMG